MGNTLYFHEDDVGAQLHPDQALLSSTPMSASPIMPDEISIELFLVNARTGLQCVSIMA